MANNGKQWTTVGRVVKKKDGKGTYIQILSDIKAGSKLSVSDPRTFLTEEQKAQLANEGEIEVTTKTGKSYKLYDSLQFELRMEQ